MQSVLFISANLSFAATSYTILHKGLFKVAIILGSDRFLSVTSMLAPSCICCLDIELPAPFLHTILQAFLTDPTLSGQFRHVLVRSDITPLKPYEQDFIKHHPLPFFFLPKQGDAFLTYLASINT